MECWIIIFFLSLRITQVHLNKFFSWLLKVRVEGYNYIGMGNSTNKKDAQSNAARDFVNYLVRINEVKSEEVPAIGVSTYGQALEMYTLMLT